jgi:hypothetical protein
MADRTSILQWLSRRSWRRVHEGERRIVERLVQEGRAAWTSPKQACARITGNGRASIGLDPMRPDP